MRWWLACALSLSLVACGGGGGDGGGDSSNDPGLPGGGGTPTPTGFNGTLDGLVIYSSTNGSTVLDLKTGGAAGMGVNMAFWPSRDGQEIVAVDTTKRATQGIDELRIQDFSGGSSTPDVPRGLQGMAQLSPSRQHIAAWWANQSAGETQPVLTIFSRTGQVVARHPTAQAAGWMPNGRLLMAQDRLLVTADVNGANPSTIATLAAAPTDVAASRDGSRIAVTMQNHVWVMDASGANLRQLTTSSANEANPEWSPDNQWLLVRQGTAGSCPNVYAVPASATSTVTLGGAAGSSAVVKLREQVTGGAATDVCASSPAGWIR